MDFLEKIFGQKLLNYIWLLIFGIILIFAPMRDVSAREIGFVMVLISILCGIYEAKLRYYIKFKKSPKEFKSGKEAFIASYFDKKKIKYIYEKKLKLPSGLIKPDFYLPEFDVYVEYWGKWNSDFEYRKECKHKRETYEKNEIKLVELYPDNLASMNQLDWKFTERLLQILKKERS